MVKASTQYKREHKADYGREKLDILFEDQWLIVVNKPSGMLSVPYPGSRARTAQGVLEELFRKRGTLSPRHKPLCVHRLDRDTSGVMMFALTEDAQKKIMDSWHQMVSERLYRAVAENPRGRNAEPLADSGLIDAPLAFNAHNVGFVPKADDRPRDNAPNARHSGEKASLSLYERHLSGSGKKCEFKTVPARTHWKIILRGKTHTLFELSLDTGKKNQIRAHLASKGYPLAGDENFRAATDPFHRLALHARSLVFTHPYTQALMRFEVPEPDDWAPYVQKGDPSPEVPVWQKERAQLRRSEKANHGKGQRDALPAHAERRLSRRDRAHMNFIQQGKHR
ncbi:MAG: RluA family pseudouridine synthase [Treponema sp.]|nr:RluA family pseudouridine synthase [Treponema sp.]